MAEKGRVIVEVGHGFRPLCRTRGFLKEGDIYFGLELNKAAFLNLNKQELPLEKEYSFFKRSKQSMVRGMKGIGKNTVFIQGMGGLPFRKGTVDEIHLQDVFEEPRVSNESRLKLVLEAFDALKPGGLLVTTGLSGGINRFLHRSDAFTLEDDTEIAKHFLRQEVLKRFMRGHEGLTRDELQVQAKRNFEICTAYDRSVQVFRRREKALKEAPPEEEKPRITEEDKRSPKEKEFARKLELYGMIKKARERGADMSELMAFRRKKRKMLAVKGILERARKKRF